MMESFTPDVSKELKHYVYRLIDPRNGQTFYVGRGQSDRVFAHMRAEEAALSEDEDELSEKLKVIRQIRNADLKPMHIIHRHGMDEETAKEVEAALIDYTSGLTNEAPGRGSRERGPANAKQLQHKYNRPVMDLSSDQELLFIKVRKNTVDDLEKGNLYEAVRKSWVLKLDRANIDGKCVLGVVDGICEGVYVDCKWVQSEGSDKRIEFEGRDVTCEKSRGLVKRCLGRLIPVELRKLGLAQPCIYWPRPHTRRENVD